MRFRYSGKDDGLKAATEYCNALYENNDFWEAVGNHPQFDETKITSAEIRDYMRYSNAVTNVHDWTPRGGSIRYRKTVAVTDRRREFAIFYHSRFFSNSVASKVNTIVHEHVHNIDYFGDSSIDIEFGHAGQSWVGNQGTAPYAIGSLAERFYVNGAKSFGGFGSHDLVCDMATVDDEEID